MEWTKIKMIGDNENMRYQLSKEGSNPLIVIGINPSTANESKPDPTMRKVMGLAEFNGFDSFCMFNVYPQRATNPDNLDVEMNREIHEKNLEIIEDYLKTHAGPTVLLAYGNNLLRRGYLKQCERGLIKLFQKYHANFMNISVQMCTFHRKQMCSLYRKQMCRRYRFGMCRL